MRGVELAKRAPFFAMISLPPPGRFRTKIAETCRIGRNTAFLHSERQTLRKPFTTPQTNGGSYEQQAHDTRRHRDRLRRAGNDRHRSGSGSSANAPDGNRSDLTCTRDAPGSRKYAERLYARRTRTIHSERSLPSGAETGTSERVAAGAEKRTSERTQERSEEGTSEWPQERSEERTSEWHQERSEERASARTSAGLPARTSAGLPARASAGLPARTSAGLPTRTSAGLPTRASAGFPARHEKRRTSRPGPRKTLIFPSQTPEHSRIEQVREFFV